MKISMRPLLLAALVGPLFSSVSPSASLAMKESYIEDHLPQEYNHINVKEQLKNYDEVYKDARPDQPHIPGLFEILKRGFSVVRSHINKKDPIIQQNKDSNIQNYKENCQEMLDLYYKSVYELDQHKEMDLDNFINTNFILAKFVDLYDAGNSLEECISKNKKVLRETIFKDKNIFPIVIYSNPSYAETQTILGYETFLNQLFSYDTPRWILQFEQNYNHIKKEKGRENLAHFGIHNVYLFLLHELEPHFYEFEAIEKNKNIMSFLKGINKLRKSIKEKVITHPPFASHENHPNK